MQKKIHTMQYWWVIIVLILTACGQAMTSLTPALETQGYSQTPTERLGPTDTMMPIISSSPTATPEFYTASQIPVGARGTPVPDWQGVPVMPGAISGSINWYIEDTYVYWIDISIDEASKFYIESLESSGWQLSYYVRNTPSGFGYSTILEFGREDGIREIIKVSISVESDENVTFIVLSRYRIGA